MSRSNPWPDFSESKGERAARNLPGALALRQKPRLGRHGKSELKSIAAGGIRKRMTLLEKGRSEYYQLKSDLGFSSFFPALARREGGRVGRNGTAEGLCWSFGVDRGKVGGVGGANDESAMKMGLWLFFAAAVVDWGMPCAVVPGGSENCTGTGRDGYVRGVALALVSCL